MEDQNQKAFRESDFFLLQKLLIFLGGRVRGGREEGGGGKDAYCQKHKTKTAL